MYLFWTGEGVALRGTHHSGQIVQEAFLHINFLELRAVRNACVHFLLLIGGKSVKVMTDNIACMFSITCQGSGGRFFFLLCQSNKAMELVYSQSYPHFSHLLSRCMKHHGWQSQQALLPRLQMGVGLSDSYSHITDLGAFVGFVVTINNRKCKQFHLSRGWASIHLRCLLCSMN